MKGRRTRIISIRATCLIARVVDADRLGRNALDVRRIANGWAAPTSGVPTPCSTRKTRGASVSRALRWRRETDFRSGNGTDARKFPRTKGWRGARMPAPLRAGLVIINWSISATLPTRAWLVHRPPKSNGLTPFCRFQSRCRPCEQGRPAARQPVTASPRSAAPAPPRHVPIVQQLLRTVRRRLRWTARR
jgi:hypothetical protein